MIHGQSTKVVSLFTPQSVATNGTATGTVAVNGWDHADIYLMLSTAAASNVDVTLTITEGDDTTYTTHADLAMTTAAPSTNAPGQVYRFDLDLKKRKKNLKITYAPNTSVARTAAAIAVLSRGSVSPTTATGFGLDGSVVK